ncbi:MAG: HD domain-containing protein [Actinomycetota bacterium]|nr:HD domain-containing protein [Actinomycetota bacterium]
MTEKKQFISDLKVGGRVESIFAVAERKVRKKRNGDDYCTVTLQDRDGSIGGVLWTETFNKTGGFNTGDFVLADGDVKAYRGGKQVVIKSLKRIENNKDLNYSDYLKTSKNDIDSMFGEIMEYISGIGNTYLKKLLDMFFGDEKFAEDFKNSTAAMYYHHAFKGGLLEHTLNVTKLCDAISRVYKDLNYDLLISGAILHDIGKMKEYRTKVTTEVTDQGKLLGHITIGYGWVIEKIKEIDGFPRDLSNRLLHIILSHHGHKEFGSPKRPKILEAFIVYHADHIDADVGGFNVLVEENKGGSDWSDYAKIFERPVLLKKLKMPGNEYSENDTGMDKDRRIVPEEESGRKDKSRNKAREDDGGQSELF